MHPECTWNALGMHLERGWNVTLLVWVYWNGVGMQLDYAGRLFWGLGLGPGVVVQRVFTSTTTTTTTPAKESEVEHEKFCDRIAGAL